MKLPTADQAIVWAQHAVTLAAGLAAGAGLQAVYGVPLTDLSTSFDHIFHGIKEIAIGLGPIVAAISGGAAALKASLPSKVADVKAAAPAQLVAAVQDVSPVTLRDAVAAQPDVRKVQVTTQAVADASPSAKVTTS